MLSLNSRESLWTVADRRLSFGGLKAPIDNAVKLMTLETSDGIAILGYAGLGATAGGIQPSTWMSTVLRGRNLPMEQSLEVLSRAASQQLPRHISRVDGGHTIIISAFVNHIGPRLYSIDNVVDPKSRSHSYRFTHYQFERGSTAVSVSLGLGGSGGRWLDRQRDSWARDIRNLIRANDAGKVSDMLVADHLAKLNVRVSRAEPATVGPTSLVAWRRRPGSNHKSGSGHQFYTGESRDADNPSVPSISNGMDISAIVAIVSDEFRRALDARSHPHDPPHLDQTKLNELLAQSPWDPDERLR